MKKIFFVLMLFLCFSIFISCDNANEEIDFNIISTFTSESSLTDTILIQDLSSLNNILDKLDDDIDSKLNVYDNEYFENKSLIIYTCLNNYNNYELKRIDSINNNLYITFNYKNNYVVEELKYIYIIIEINSSKQYNEIYTNYVMNVNN